MSSQKTLGAFAEAALRSLTVIVLVLVATPASADYERGVACFRAGNFQCAIEEFYECVRQNPESFLCRYMLAHSYKAVGNDELALIHMHIAYELDPSSEPTWHYLDLWTEGRFEDVTLQAEFDLASPVPTVGSVVHLSLTILNTGYAPLTEISLLNSWVSFCTAGNPAASLPRAASYTCDSYYDLTQADINAGSISHPMSIDALGQTGDPVVTDVTVVIPLPLVASDSFDGPGSGDGWADSDTWDGAVLDGVATVTGSTAYRSFASTIDTTATDKLYLSFDLRSTGDLGWAGVSLFAGPSELIFTGHHAPPSWSFLVYGGASPVHDTGVPIDNATHSFVVEVDFGGGTAGNDLVRLFIDDRDLVSPDAVADLDPALIPDAIDGARIGASGTVMVDNLCVSRTLEPCATSTIFLDGFESGDTFYWN